MTVPDGSRGVAPLAYAGAHVHAEVRPQSRAGVASMSFFVALCGWFLWGLLKVLDAFYAGPGIPGANWLWWQLLVAIVGTAGAALGLALGLWGLLDRRSYRTLPIIGICGNALALMVFGTSLITTMRWRIR